MEEWAISTNNLSKRFEKHVAVNDVDLNIKAGEVYGLIGPNGAGKTTLIRMLAAVEHPTKGEVYIHGQPLNADSNNSSYKKRLGYLPDDFPVYEDLTVWDYLDYFARLYHLDNSSRRHRLYEVLELVQLANKRLSLISTLSRGMKQRLSLARTIIHEPIVLLLDEPVSGLDPIARVQFRQIIRVLQEAGMTILISSHVLSDLSELCTSIGIMELGYLVESASLKEIRERRSRQQITMTTLGEITDLERELRQNYLVDGWEFLPNRGRLRVNFNGSEEEGANLLKNLIQSDIAIVEFSYLPESLESIFLNLGHKQAS
jgi:ABC-2 type transport system ATP-binding protein